MQRRPERRTLDEAPAPLFFFNGDHMTTTTKERRSYAKRGIPSVTTLLGVLSKPALVPWAARVASEATAAAIAAGETHDAAIAIGKSAPNKRRDTSADLGTLAHEYAERLLRGEDVPEPERDDRRARRGAVALATWVDAQGFTILSVERELAGNVDGLDIAGTCDLILANADGIVVADLKTGKTPYNEAIAQIAAYRLLARDEELAGGHGADPRAYLEATGLVLHVAMPDDDVTEPVCAPIAIDRETLDAGERIFRSCCTIYRAQKIAKLPSVKGDA